MSCHFNNLLLNLSKNVRMTILLNLFITMFILNDNSCKILNVCGKQ